MSLTESIKLFLGVEDDGQIRLRTTRVIMDGIEVVGENHHSRILEPGQDVSASPPKVRTVCAAVWTPEVVTAFKQKLAASQA